MKLSNFKCFPKIDNVVKKSNVFAEKEDDAYTDFSAQWTMSTASSVLTLCFLIEVIMKMIAFTPYGKSLMHIRYNYENIFSDLNTKNEIELCLSFLLF